MAKRIKCKVLWSVPLDGCGRLQGPGRQRQTEPRVSAVDSDTARGRDGHRQWRSPGTNQGLTAPRLGRFGKYYRRGITCGLMIDRLI